MLWTTRLWSMNLGADFLEVAQIVMMIQDEFNIELSDDVAEAVITVGDAIYVLRRKPRANRSRGKMSRAGTKAEFFHPFTVSRFRIGLRAIRQMMSRDDRSATILASASHWCERRRGFMLSKVERRRIFCLKPS